MENELRARITLDISNYQGNLERVNRSTRRELNQTEQHFDSFSNTAKKALAGVVAFFTVDTIIRFGKAVLDTTAKFQKFEAVLTNTLGSQSEAQRALVQISEFAAKTPFQVDELTASFIKLANQGFKATTSELTLLGDLAASTGKSFDQLVEAILDAQVGEFERLKEFGIRARVEGDQVKFTFKGVETQVNNTSEAIRAYILGLGDAEGVTGSMAAISQTLGGKLSNLGDNLEQLKLAIGDQTSGIFAASIDWLNEFISLATLASKSVAKIKEEASQAALGNVIDQNIKQVEELAQKYREIDPNITEQGALAKAIADVSRSYREALVDVDAFRKQAYTTRELKEIVEGFNQYAISVLSVSNSADKANVSFEEFSETADDFNKRFFTDGAQAAKTYNDQIQETIRITEKLDEAYKEIISSFKDPFEKISSEIDVDLKTNGPPIDENTEAFDSLKSNLDVIDSKAKQVKDSFSVLGSVISTVFKDNPGLGQFVSSLAKFAGEIIARNFAIAKSNAVAGASAAGVATGPAAPFVTPGLIAAAIAVVATAFSGIFKGASSGSSGGGGSSQTFGNTGKREFGGPVTKGQAYIVGEKRPELFVPNTNGVIIPQLPRVGGTATGGGGTMKIEVEVKGRIDGESIRLSNKRANTRVRNT